MAENRLEQAQTRPLETQSDRVETVVTEAADKMIGAEAGLGRDLIALMTLLFVVVTYHLQNPILIYQVDFGKAFRENTLQVVAVLGLIVGMYALLTGNLPDNQRKPDGVLRDPSRLLLGTALGIYALHVFTAVILRFNIFGVLLDIPQAAFWERRISDDLLPVLQSALTFSAVLEYIALIAVILLWSPWERLGVYRRVIIKNAPALLVAALVLVLWETLTVAFQVEEFLLPRPSVIGATYAENYPIMIATGWNTFLNAFWGFVLGCGLGIVTGVVSARFTSFSQALLPLAIAANSVPIIALAPIMNNWFGVTEPASKIAIVAILTYFPTMISTVRGLTSVDRTALELMQTYAASQVEVFRKLRIPAALPFVFSALKVATTLSMIAAIVSEYFGGSTQGLGYRIRDYALTFDYPEAWAGIFMASLFGILFYLVVSSVERLLMPWHVSFREG